MGKDRSDMEKLVGFLKNLEKHHKQDNETEYDEDDMEMKWLPRDPKEDYEKMIDNRMSKSSLSLSVLSLVCVCVCVTHACLPVCVFYMCLYLSVFLCLSVCLSVCVPTWERSGRVLDSRPKGSGLSPTGLTALCP